MLLFHELTSELNLTAVPASVVRFALMVAIVVSLLMLVTGKDNGKGKRKAKKQN